MIEPNPCIYSCFYYYFYEMHSTQNNIIKDCHKIIFGLKIYAALVNYHTTYFFPFFYLHKYFVSFIKRYIYDFYEKKCTKLLLLLFYSAVFFSAVVTAVLFNIAET